jgi:hypothetical protein
MECGDLSPLYQFVTSDFPGASSLLSTSGLNAKHGSDKSQRLKDWMPRRNGKDSSEKNFQLFSRFRHFSDPVLAPFFNR